MLVRLVVVLVIGAGCLAGQTQIETTGALDDPGLIITAEASLVIVPLHVHKGGKSVNGLNKDAFKLFEDGVEKEIAFVEGPARDGAAPSEGRSVPVEIAVLLDISHSVLRRRLIDINTLKVGLLDELKPNVTVSLYGFAGKLYRFAKPTRDPARLELALERAYAAEHGASKVYESITQTARDLGGREGNSTRMLVVFSDGANTTDFDPEWTVRMANAFNIPIYPVVLGHEQNNARRARANVPVTRRGQIRMPNRGRGGGRTTEQEKRQQRFADIGRATGGQSIDLRNPSSKAVQSILKSLGTLASTEYVVGYYPSGGEEGSTAAVEVQLASKKTGKLFGGRRMIVH